MNARDILESVAAAYGALRTLSLEIVTVTESGDESNSGRSEQRTKAWFEAPHKVRMEQGGRRGMVLVTDGVDSHILFAAAGFPKYYSRHAARSIEHVPGVFRSEFGAVGGHPPPFLFFRIAEKVISVEVTAEEPDSFLIAAIYDEPPNPMRRLSSPVQFSVDSRTRLIKRVEAEVTMRTPAYDGVRISKHAVSFENAIIDEPIPPDVFTFVPPADAVLHTGPGGFAFGRGSGAGGGGRIATSRHRSQDGETMIDTYKLKAHGLDLTFERRLTFSQDGRELTISERIIGPRGETTRDLTMPLA
jgi:hypothetical protein